MSMVVTYTYFVSSLLMQVAQKVSLILFSSPGAIKLFAEFHNLLKGRAQIGSPLVLRIGQMGFGSTGVDRLLWE
jgi:hypothetical protein